MEDLGATSLPPFVGVHSLHHPLSVVPEKLLLRAIENKEAIGDRQHGFTRGRSCLTNLVPFYDGVAALVGRERATDIIYLDSCKALALSPMISKLERHGSDGRTTRWVRNWRDGCTQRVAVRGSVSSQKPVTSGIPQGSAY